MNKVIEATKAVANELRLPGAIGPGLRKRLEEVRLMLLIWLASEEKRVPSEYRQVRGQSVRKRVPNEAGGYRYEITPTLVTTDKVLRGKLIRSTRYESIETLLKLVASCFGTVQPRELTRGSGEPWSKQACADAIVALCEYLATPSDPAPKTGDAASTKSPESEVKMDAYFHPIFSLNDELKRANPKLRRIEVVREYISRLKRDKQKWKSETDLHGTGSELEMHYSDQLRNHKDKYQFP